MIGKLALINDSVIEINENYSVVRLGNKYAYYSNNKLSEYEYSDVHRLTKHITCLTEENSNNIVALDKYGKQRCRLVDFLSDTELHEQLQEFTGSFEIAELLDGCSTNTKSNNSYRGIKLTKKRDKDAIKLDLSISYRDYSALIDKDTLEWILPLSGAYKFISTEKLGHRTAMWSKEKLMGQRWGEQVCAIIDSKGNIKFGPVYAQITRMGRKGDLYSYTNRGGDVDRDCGILRLEPDGSLVTIFESNSCDNKYYNDNFILVSRGISNKKVYNIINKQGEKVFEFDINKIESDRGVSDIVCSYTDKDHAEQKVVLTPESNTIKIFDNKCEFMRVAFKTLKVIYPNGKFIFYDEGKEYETMAFQYSCAKRLNMPLCNETLFGAMDDKLDWYVTDKFGEPIDIMQYGTFEEIQAEFKNKLSIPLDRKTIKYSAI